MITNISMETRRAIAETATAWAWFPTLDGGLIGVGHDGRILYDIPPPPLTFTASQKAAIGMLQREAAEAYGEAMRWRERVDHASSLAAEWSETAATNAARLSRIVRLLMGIEEVES